MNKFTDRRIKIFFSTLSTFGFLAASIWIYLGAGLKLKRVCVLTSLEKPPLSEAQLLEKAGLELSKTPWLPLSLPQVELNLLGLSLVEHVQLEKKFDDSLDLVIFFRRPFVILQTGPRQFEYLDEHGFLFSSPLKEKFWDVPLISGIAFSDSDRLQEALDLVQSFDRSKLHTSTLLAAVDWNAQSGFRALIKYPLKSEIKDKINDGKTLRTWLQFGLTLDPELGGKWILLERVLHYLERNSLRARQIRLDLNQQIVLKI